MLILYISSCSHTLWFTQAHTQSITQCNARIAGNVFFILEISHSLTSLSIFCRIFSICLITHSLTKSQLSINNTGTGRFLQQRDRFLDEIRRSKSPRRRPSATSNHRGFGALPRWGWAHQLCTYEEDTCKYQKTFVRRKDLRVRRGSRTFLYSKKYVWRCGKRCGGSCDGRFQRYGVVLRTDWKW